MDGNTRNVGGGSANDAGDEAEEDSDSDSSILSALEQFRLEWSDELKRRNRSVFVNERNDGTISESTCEQPSREEPSGCFTDKMEQAKDWFLQGAKLEKKGDFYDAVRYYRKAVQLVPDIEYRVSSTAINDKVSSSGHSSESDADDEQKAFIGHKLKNTEHEKMETEEDDVPMLKRFLRDIEARGWVFFEKQLENNGKHFADLPVEVISYILRWVVSQDLDLRSLEMISFVSKGFYCMARDETIWASACDKFKKWYIFGLGLGAIDVTYWKIITPSEICTLGVQESDLMDATFVRFLTFVLESILFRIIHIDSKILPRHHRQIIYPKATQLAHIWIFNFMIWCRRPWHIVEYYRYLRFFPDGQVLFFTTPDPPTVTVGLLRDRNPKIPAILKGRFFLHGDSVTAIVKRTTVTSIVSTKGRHQREQKQESTNTFHLEFQISSLNKISKFNNMLKWTHYAIFSQRTPVNVGRLMDNARNNLSLSVSSTSFDLHPNKYPPLYFSRVKSYSAKSESVL